MSIAETTTMIIAETTTMSIAETTTMSIAETTTVVGDTTEPTSSADISSINITLMLSSFLYFILF